MLKSCMSVLEGNVMICNYEHHKCDTALYHYTVMDVVGGLWGGGSVGGNEGG